MNEWTFDLKQWTVTARLRINFIPTDLHVVNGSFGHERISNGIINTCHYLHSSYRSFSPLLPEADLHPLLFWVRNRVLSVAEFYFLSRKWISIELIFLNFPSPLTSHFNYLCLQIFIKNCFLFNIYYLLYIIVSVLFNHSPGGLTVGLWLVSHYNYGR